MFWWNIKHNASGEIRKQIGLPNTIEMSKKLTEMGYFMYTGAKYTSVIGLKNQNKNRLLKSCCKTSYTSE